MKLTHVNSTSEKAILSRTALAFEFASEDPRGLPLGLFDLSKSFFEDKEAPPTSRCYLDWTS